MTLGIALAALTAWLVLLLGRGFFWQARDDDSDAASLPDPARWPAVTAIVPARDEAETIAATVRSLTAQDYPGPLRIIVVDDRSSDGTGDLARAAGDARLTVVTGRGKAPGWTGKLHALEQGLAEAGRRPEAADYLLFTDADIEHDPDSLRRLVQRAEAGRLDLVSLMARLRCESAAEKWLIPAFVFFFQMLYPFRWSNRPGTRTAAAAGGCVLLRRSAFEARGGLAPIRSNIIDDCALARLMKSGGGRIWIGLTERVRSLRAYDDIGTIRRMVARTAYAQLLYNPLLLGGMVAALALVFLAPPLLALFGAGWARDIGLFTWALMALAYAPMLRRFGLSPWRALALPGIAAAYMLFTLDSAIADWRGKGGLWKGEARPVSRE
ncbi:MAG: glycosyltransferase [Acetobacteraceae bacterium]|nr:glycosyltransferase [Acetobacteraceae bacterium]